MAKLSPDQYFAAIADNADQLSQVVASKDPQLAIPTCPDWTLRKLASHLGRTHRWVAETVRARALEPLTMSELPDGKAPAGQVEQAAWLRTGAQRLVDEISEAGDDRIWTFAGTAPATFWARRMAHETLVHRVDGELATGRKPDLDPVLAADAIDEWLDLLGMRRFADASEATAPLPPGAVLHLHATDDGLAGSGEWLVRLDRDALAVEPGHGKGDVAVTGPAAALLLTLLRRQPEGGRELTSYGDSALLTRWLDHTPF
jgi:uncharacterized protein (TIGR03083 family)